MATIDFKQFTNKILQKMILLSKNEAQAKVMLQKITVDRQDIADTANEVKANLEAISKDVVSFDLITDLLAIDSDDQLAIELFTAWKIKKGIDLPLSMIRTNDQQAWPSEIKKAFFSILLLKDMSMDLSRYWNDKKKSFVALPITEAEQKAVYKHFEEYVVSNQKKEQFNFMRVQADIINEFNGSPQNSNSLTNQITPAKLGQLLPHYSNLLKGHKEGENRKRGKQGYFIYEVNKERFINQAPRPEIFI